jgi:hypothetical protein
MRISDLLYFGTVLITVGVSLTLTGSIAFYIQKEDSSMNAEYSQYFLPILIIGIIIAALGTAAFIQAKLRNRQKIPPPPLPPPPPPPSY